MDAFQYRAGSAEDRKYVSRCVIKPVGILVFTEGYIFIPMHAFDTPVRTIESQYHFGIRVFKAGNQPDSFVFGIGNTPLSCMLSLSNDPDDGLNTWPSFTHVLAESLHWQYGGPSVINPTVADFWWGLPFLEGKNRRVKSRGDFLLEI